MIIFKKVELIHTLLWWNNHMCKQYDMKLKLILTSILKVESQPEEELCEKLQGAIIYPEIWINFSNLPSVVLSLGLDTGKNGRTNNSSLISRIHCNPA